MKKIFYALQAFPALFLLLLSQLGFGQQVEMAFDLRSSGKIYVVVAVLSIIFLGLIIYLILIDRKINKIEREIGEIEKNSR